MRRDIEDIKWRLLETYEDGVDIDIAAWMEQYPEGSADLLDFWLLLKGSPRLDTLSNAATEVTSVGDEVARALRDACLAVSFGPQWLEASAELTEKTDRALGASLSHLRGLAQSAGRTAPLPFRRAVILAWIVGLMSPKRERVSRLAVQKVTYLLEEAVECGVFVGHGKKPLGPYDPKMRYKDAEPIATKKGWVAIDRTAFAPGPSIDEALKYVGRYVKSEEVAAQFVLQLSGLADDELELWATAVMSARALEKESKAVSPQSVWDYIERTPVWSGKIERATFSLARIAAAVERLRRLALLPGI